MPLAGEELTGVAALRTDITHRAPAAATPPAAAAGLPALPGLGELTGALAAGPAKTCVPHNSLCLEC